MEKTVEKIRSWILKNKKRMFKSKPQLWQIVANECCLHYDDVHDAINGNFQYGQTTDSFVYIDDPR